MVVCDNAWVLKAPSRKAMKSAGINFRMMKLHRTCRTHRTYVTYTTQISYKSYESCKSYSILIRSVRLSPRLLFGLLFAERLGDEALRRSLRVVVIVAVADRLVVFGDCAFALADGVPGVTAIDVRPDLHPIGSEVAVQRLIEGVERLVPVTLGHVNRSEVVPGPRIPAVEFDCGLELLLGLDVFLFAEMLDAAADDHALAQLFGTAHYFRVGVDDHLDRLALGHDVEIHGRAFHHQRLSFGSRLGPESYVDGHLERVQVLFDRSRDAEAVLGAEHSIIGAEFRHAGRLDPLPEEEPQVAPGGLRGEGLELVERDVPAYIFSVIIAKHLVELLFPDQLAQHIEDKRALVKDYRPVRRGLIVKVFGRVADRSRLFERQRLLQLGLNALQIESLVLIVLDIKQRTEFGQPMPQPGLVEGLQTYRLPPPLIRHFARQFFVDPRRQRARRNEHDSRAGVSLERLFIGLGNDQTVAERVAAELRRIIFQVFADDVRRMIGPFFVAGLDVEIDRESAAVRAAQDIFGRREIARQDRLRAGERPGRKLFLRLLTFFYLLIFFRPLLDSRDGSDRLLAVTGDEHVLRDFDVNRISGAVADVFVKREPSRGVEKIGALVANVSQARVRDRPALRRFESAFVFERQRHGLFGGNHIAQVDADVHVFAVILNELQAVCSGLRGQVRLRRGRFGTLPAAAWSAGAGRRRGGRVHARDATDRERPVHFKNDRSGFRLRNKPHLGASLQQLGRRNQFGVDLVMLNVNIRRALLRIDAAHGQRERQRHKHPKRKYFFHRICPHFIPSSSSLARSLTALFVSRFA